MKDPKIKKKVIIVLSSYAPSLTKFRGDMISTFLDNSYNVICFSPSGEHTDIFYELRLMGAQPYTYPIQRTGYSILSDLKTLIGLAKIFARFRNSTVISYTIKPVFYGSAVSKLFSGVRHISMITGMPSILHSLSQFALSRFVVKKVMQGNSKIFFQNSDDEKYFYDLGYLQQEQAVRINGSGVNLEIYGYEPTPSLTSPTSFLLIARLLHEKGIIEFIEAAKLVLKRYSQSRFSIVGWFDSDNPDAVSEEDFYSLIEDSQIKFLGRFKDVRPAIRTHSVFVLPSYHEGMPRTVLEAMAIGRPIITTDVPGCRDTVEEGVNGFLVPKGESVSLAEAMMRFIQSPELIKPMGAASRKLAERKYDVNMVNQRILAVLDS